VFGGDAPFQPSNVWRRAQRAWKRAGLEPIGLHEARHTFASVLIAAGVNARHSSTTTTRGARTLGRHVRSQPRQSSPSARWLSRRRDRWRLDSPCRELGDSPAATSVAASLHSPRRWIASRAQMHRNAKLSHHSCTGVSPSPNAPEHESSAARSRQAGLGADRRRWRDGTGRATRLHAHAGGRGDRRESLDVRPPCPTVDRNRRDAVGNEAHPRRRAQATDRRTATAAGSRTATAGEARTAASPLIRARRPHPGRA
jgi:hypothetical protein